MATVSINGTGAGAASPIKDRKKSAHWTDNDTETLVNILLRFKDTGRTPDNGFRPEVWKEASLVLEKSTFIGGPKTPEACKSRWQRIQRDFRAAKDIEAMPGFTWDRHEGRLIASPEAWRSAESQLEPYKYSRIHLTCYDTLGILCPNDPARARTRTKGRSSHASTSDTSSMISLSVTGSTSHLDDLGQSQGYQHQHPHQHGGMQMADMQGGMNGGMMWEPTGEEDGEGEFDQFSLGDGSHHPFMPQKRLPYDPSLMAPSSSHGIMSNQGLNGSHSNGASPPKKPRLQSSRPSQPLHGNHSQLYAMTLPQSPTYNTQPGLLDPAVLTPGHPTQQHPHAQQQQRPHQLHQNHQHQQARQHGLPNHAQAPPHNLMMNNQPQSQVQTPNPSPLQSTHPGSSTLPARQQQQPLHATASTDTNMSSSSNPNQTSNHRIAESHHPLSHAHAQPQTHHQSQRPNQPHNPTQNQIQNQQNQNHNLNVNNPTLTPNHHPNAMTNANPNPHTPVSMTTERGYQPSPQLAPEIQQAGLSDAQRRTQALLQLQQEQGMRDDELVEVITEFQDSIAAVDTYLAIQKDALRRMWLTNVIQQRRRQAA